MALKDVSLCGDPCVARLKLSFDSFFQFEGADVVRVIYICAESVFFDVPDPADTATTRWGLVDF